MERACTLNDTPCLGLYLGLRVKLNLRIHSCNHSLSRKLQFWAGMSMPFSERLTTRCCCHFNITTLILIN